MAYAILLQNHVHHVQPIVAIVLSQFHSAEMERVIRMKPVIHAQQIVLDHVHALMVKCVMIQMYVCHIMYIVNQGFQARIGMEQHVSVRLNM